MADIRIVSAPADGAVAAQLAAQLRALGWTVEGALTGAADRATELTGPAGDVSRAEPQDPARCVLVLWSTAAVAVGEVRDEARAGLARGSLVAVRLDDAVPPAPFTQLPAHDADPDAGGPSNNLVRALRGLLGRPAVADAAAGTEPAGPHAKVDSGRMPVDDLLLYAPLSLWAFGVWKCGGLLAEHAALVEGDAVSGTGAARRARRLRLLAAVLLVAEACVLGAGLALLELDGGRRAAALLLAGGVLFAGALGCFVLRLRAILRDHEEDEREVRERTGRAPERSRQGVEAILLALSLACVAPGPALCVALFYGDARLFWVLVPALFGVGLLLHFWLVSFLRRLLDGHFELP